MTMEYSDCESLFCALVYRIELGRELLGFCCSSCLMRGVWIVFSAKDSSEYPSSSSSSLPFLAAYAGLMLAAGV